MSFYRTLGLLTIASLALASPVAQMLDMDFVEDQIPAPAPVIAVGQASQVVTINQASLIASVVRAASASPFVTLDAAKLKRGGVTASITPTSASQGPSCVGGTAQPTGYGPATSPDTPAAFAGNPVYGQVARAAQAPAGYTEDYMDLNASSIAYGYLGYTTLQSYDTSACAAKCDAIKDCQSIDIYFERAPSIDPGTGSDCLDPTSTTLIKCAFWGSPLTLTSANNTGQYRKNFEVVIRGSNAYSKNTQSTSPGYTTPTCLGDATINAPLDCNGYDTYMGVRYFNSGPFNIDLCAAACTAETDYDVAHPPAVGKPMLCTFFTTYLLYKNGVAQGQYCALYNQTWGPEYATNVGQYNQQGDHFTIGSSYASSNATNPGVCA